MRIQIRIYLSVTADLYRILTNCNLPISNTRCALNQGDSCNALTICKRGTCQTSRSVHYGLSVVDALIFRTYGKCALGNRKVCCSRTLCMDIGLRSHHFYGIVANFRRNRCRVTFVFLHGQFIILRHLSSIMRSNRQGWLLPILNIRSSHRHRTCASVYR